MSDIDVSEGFRIEFGTPVQDDLPLVQGHNFDSAGAYACAICHRYISRRYWYVCPTCYKAYRHTMTDDAWKALCSMENERRKNEDEENEHTTYLEDLPGKLTGKRQRHDNGTEIAEYVPDDPERKSDGEYLFHNLISERLISATIRYCKLSPSETQVWRSFYDPIIEDNEADQKSAAAALNMSYDTYRRHLSNARAKVKKALETEGDLAHIWRDVWMF